jgi:hypothetical protein
VVTGSPDQRAYAERPAVLAATITGTGPDSRAVQEVRDLAALNDLTADPAVTWLIALSILGRAGIRPL